MEKRICELEELIRKERNNNLRENNERDCKIKNLRNRLQGLGQDYDDVMTTKSSLDSEISIYRKLLDGEERRFDRLFIHLDSLILFV